ncbi:MAG TPA: hypothetical protein VKJ07_18710, partial [Mycobacteriales bacterium]|nr:hypothetical protein [Mycobacteriales bacterium]
EPPDQGLCAGNGHVVEVVNDVIRTYSTSGTSETGDEALNTFFHYPDAIDRGTLTQGPSVTDPSCLYDAASGKFVVAVLTYEVIPTGSHRGRPTGANHIDLAVSQTGDPAGAWNLYSFAVQDDGTQGTPVHNNCPCLGDYPHIGMDANGFYVTTNEYPWFVDGFNGAQVYAISKSALTGGMPLSAVHFDNLNAGSGPAFTMWPANSNPGDYSKDAGGTEYFLSSMATAEANNANGIDNRIAVWSLEHTKQLDGQTQNVSLRYQVLGTETYGVPPISSQRAGNTPLVDCANTAFCATALFNTVDPYTESLSQLDSNDSRMQQVWYVNGTLVGALDTIASVGGHDQAGIAYFSVNPHGIARLASQGYLAVAGNNANYPAMATLPNGKGVMAFTLVGSDWYPSAAYAPVTVGSDGTLTVGNVSVAHAGAGPQDGFSGLKIESPTGDGVARPRWGDYGAAAVDGSSIWIASEDIHQTCDFATYLATNFRCGSTRTSLGNWSTQITRVNP